MQKTKKSRAILSGISVLLVLCLLAGGTMAWFTDTEKVNTNFAAGILDISVKPGEAASTDLTFDNLRPMLLDNFEAELAGNGSDKWTNDVTQDNTTGVYPGDYDPVPAYFKPVVITNDGTLPTKVQISLELDETVTDQEPVLTEDGFTITQGEMEACDNGLKDALKVFVYYNRNNLNSGAWTQVEDVNLNTDYAGEDDEANDTYTTVMIPAGGSVRYVIAGYLPENAGNDYQGQHYHGKLVLNAYQMDTTDGGDPDDIVINEVNKDLLQDLYDMYAYPIYQLGGDGFLPDGWTVFENALQQAEEVLNKADATDDEVANVYEKLSDSLANLISIDESEIKDSLNYIIEKAESIVPAIDAGKYEEAGIEKFRAALAKAKEVREDTTAPESEIKEAIYNLNDALMNLRLKNNTNGITTFAANTVDPMDVQVALVLTQYVAERDNLDTLAMLDAFFAFLG